MTIADDWIALLDGPRLTPSDPGAHIRPSRFPFCARRYGWRHLIEPEADDFRVRAEMYTGLGRAAHSVIQAALVRAGRLARCEDEVRDDGIGLVGHIDGVLDGSRVFELKTAGHSKVLALRRMTEDARQLAFTADAPWTGYRDQALTYAALLGLDEAEVLIVSRDNPATCVSVTLTGARGHYAVIRERIRNARHTVSLRVLPAADTGPACTYCPRKEVCESPPLPDGVTDDGVW